MVHPRFPPAAAGFIHADARFVDNHVHTGRARSPDSKNIHKSSSCLPVESTHSLETNPAALVTSENVRLATIPVRDPHGSNRAKLTNRSSTPTTAHLHFLDTKRRFQSPVADTHPLAKGSIQAAVTGGTLCEEQTFEASCPQDSRRWFYLWFLPPRAVPSIQPP